MVFEFSNGHASKTQHLCTRQLVQTRKECNDFKPEVKQIRGAVVSLNPAHTAFSTAVLSNFPSRKGRTDTLGDYKL